MPGTDENQVGGVRGMRVLIACEESQTDCMAFRALGHEAYSMALKVLRRCEDDKELAGRLRRIAE